MKILDRYLIKTMAFYTLSVMFIWLGVYVFFNFIGEIKLIGEAQYTLIEAVQYVLLDIPAVLYSHSPVIILLGSLLALAHLAQTSQLVIIRNSGVSIIQITSIVVRAALMFIFIAIIVGEWIAPITTQYAESSRSKALGGSVSNKSQQNFWVKNDNIIMRVGQNIDGHLFSDVMLIELKNTKAIKSVFHAENALFNGEELVLEQPKGHQINRTNNQFYEISPSQPKHSKINVSFDQEFVNSLRKEPKDLSTWSLYKQINFLVSNGLASGSFEVELYKRLVKPFTLVAMILFSMLFVFGSIRDTSFGKKIFLGLALSLVFELASKIGGVLSLRFDYNHLLIAFMPSLIFIIIALVLLKRKSAQ